MKVVAQTTLCQAIQSRRVDWAAKRCGCTKAHVVNQNDDDIGRTLRRLHLEERRRFNIAYIQLFEFGWVGLGKRQVRAVYLVGLHTDRCGQKSS